MERLVQIGDRLDPVTLADPHGRPVNLFDLVDRPTVIPLVRYYGCMPCRAFLYQLEDVRAELDAAGVQVIGVGGAADYQAQDLMEHGIGFPLLLDPDHRLYAALDLHHIPWWAPLKPTTWAKYLRAARRARQGRVTDHVLQAPGLAVLDGDRVVRLLHRGQTLGDYPPVPEILSAAKSIVQ